MEHFINTKYEIEKLQKKNKKVKRWKYTFFPEKKQRKFSNCQKSLFSPVSVWAGSFLSFRVRSRSSEEGT